MKNAASAHNFVAVAANALQVRDVCAGGRLLPLVVAVATRVRRLQQCWHLIACESARGALSPQIVAIMLLLSSHKHMQTARSLRHIKRQLFFCSVHLLPLAQQHQQQHQQKQ